MTTPQTPHTLRLSPESKAEVLLEHGPGAVRLYRCGMCGWTSWGSTDRSQPDDVVVELDNSGRCKPCFEVQRRYPELYMWVAGVANMAIAHGKDTEAKDGD